MNLFIKMKSSVDNHFNLIYISIIDIFPLRSEDEYAKLHLRYSSLFIIKKRNITRQNLCTEETQWQLRRFIATANRRNDGKTFRSEVQ